MATTTTPLSLGTDKLSKLLARYALPAIIAMVSSSLYNMTDSIFIGHGVGALAISGLALTMPLMNITAAFGSMVGIGASALVSIRLGQGNRRDAVKIMSNAVILNIVLGLTIGILGLVFLDDILGLFGASDDTLPYAREYMRIILYGNIVTHIYLGLNEVLRASGYPKRAMGIMLTAVAINCVLDPLFIFVFRWGIAGSAIATVISQCTAFTLEMVHFNNPRSFLHFERKLFRFDSKIVKNILTIGLAPFLLHICASLVTVLVNTALKTHGGDLYIGAYGIINRVVMLFVMIVAGLNQGMQPIVGYNYGARQFDRVVKVLKMTICCAVVVTTVGFLLGMLMPHLIVKIFVGEGSEGAAQLIAVAEHGLRIVVAVFPVVGFQIVTSNFFQYIGKPQKAIALSMTRQLLFLVPLLATLPNWLGHTGVWLSMPIADALSVLLAAVLLHFQLKRFRNPESEKII